MPRAPRIEYEDAAYHVMARGNRRQPIVHSDFDREVFAETLAEAADLAKLRTYAWVLMDNHYHWVLETPKANLVESMTWFQNAIEPLRPWASGGKGAEGVRKEIPSNRLFRRNSED